MDDQTSTLILTRDDLAALMRPADYLQAVEAGFRALGVGEAVSPAPLHLPFPHGGLHAKGAVWRAPGMAAVKVNANVPDNPALRGLPTIQGAVLLVDTQSGRLLAILDSVEITLGRTAAASALAARLLARPDAETLAVCGCGAQALPHVLALREVLQLRRVRLHDLDPARAEALAQRLEQRADLEVRALDRLEDATREAEVIVTCTTARSPFLDLAHVSPGAFIAAVGTDAPDKHEITPRLMAHARVVADVLDQALAMGDLRHAVAAGAMDAGDVHAELADLVCGRAQGRAHPSEIWLFDSTGSGVQDVAAAGVAHARALAAGKGMSVRLAGSEP
ncbi:MAG: ornithine cyclodeaminase family protein [Proteobacteria bacterium]|nr:ornithine cyclodeaminase family protein [Pseudomonadota bacterium]